MVTTKGNQWMEKLPPNSQDDALNIIMNSLSEQADFDLTNPANPSK